MIVLKHLKFNRNSLSKVFFLKSLKNKNAMVNMYISHALSTSQWKYGDGFKSQLSFVRCINSVLCLSFNSITYQKNYQCIPNKCREI